MSKACCCDQSQLVIVNHTYTVPVFSSVLSYTKIKLELVRVHCPHASGEFLMLKLIKFCQHSFSVNIHATGLEIEKWH